MPLITRITTASGARIKVVLKKERGVTDNYQDNRFEKDVRLTRYWAEIHTEDEIIETMPESVTEHREELKTVVTLDVFYEAILQATGAYHTHNDPSDLWSPYIPGLIPRRGGPENLTLKMVEELVH